MRNLRTFLLRRCPETSPENCSELSVVTISLDQVISESKSLSLASPSSSRISTNHIVDKYPIQLSKLSKCLVYFRTYFTITYWLCLSPFTIVYNPRSRSYELSNSKIQNLFCLIIQASILFQFGSHCRGLDIKTIRLDPTNYFEIANVLGAFAYYMVLFRILWTRQKKFLKIFNIFTVNLEQSGLNKYVHHKQ